MSTLKQCLDTKPTFPEGFPTGRTVPSAGQIAAHLCRGLPEGSCRGHNIFSYHFRLSRTLALCYVSCHEGQSRKPEKSFIRNNLFYRVSDSPLLLVKCPFWGKTVRRGKERRNECLLLLLFPAYPLLPFMTAYVAPGLICRCLIWARYRASI